MRRFLPLILLIALVGLLVTFLGQLPVDEVAVSPAPLVTERVENPSTDLPEIGTPGNGVSGQPEASKRAAAREPALHISARSGGGGAPPPSVQISVLPEDNEFPERHFKLAGTSTKVGVRPGSWTVLFEAEGYAPDSVEVTVEPGDDLPVVGTLQRYAHVTGRIVDIYGKPGGQGRLWFLKPGQPMPDGPSEQDLAPWARFGRRGELLPVDLLPGTYNVAYGVYTKAHLEQSVTLEAGKETALEVVVGGRAHISVELDQPIDAHRVSVFLEEDRKKRKQDKQDKRPDRPDSPESKAANHREEREKEWIEEGKAWRLEQWKAVGRANIDEAAGEMTRVKPGSEYRVVLEVDGVRYGTDPFVTIEENQACILQVQVPVPLLTKADLRNLEGMPDGRRVPFPLIATMIPDEGQTRAGEGIYLQ
jgi:hypothetical protein